jgi:hypothetical protein
MMMMVVVMMMMRVLSTHTQSISQTLLKETNQLYLAFEASEFWSPDSGMQEKTQKDKRSKKPVDFVSSFVLSFCVGVRILFPFLARGAHYYIHTSNLSGQIIRDEEKSKSKREVYLHLQRETKRSFLPSFPFLSFPLLPSHARVYRDSRCEKTNCHHSLRV